MVRTQRKAVLLVCFCCLLFRSVTSQDAVTRIAERAPSSSTAGHASSTPRASAAGAGADLTMGKNDATQTDLPVRFTSASSSDSTPTSAPVFTGSSGTTRLVSFTHTTHAPLSAASAGIASVSFPPHHDPPGTHPHPPPTQTTTSQSLSTHSHHQPTVAIVFEALAGVVGLIVVLALGRCYWSWKKTPRQDRIAALVNRHALDREMAELERAQLQQRIRARQAECVPPPPPYVPAPPAYDAIAQVEQAV
ncbi:hypothetical protein CERSUDRAFT_91697 [Gelatoporia subvermispora B]|uniref:Transmembrane protein n=1 Tax=Ceriporiopsis subvermispora (strain B) TaxID=914234 RepID=M2RQ15_CERS8|nr:hypothetical protein CERSUDRAFT_91697 [Gelatoporia subvermispora B]